MTYFPGGLIFAPNWRGTRWDFQATVELELFDSQSGDLVGTYAVESDHRLIHTTGNPMHFLFAALVIPGTIFGSGKTWVRANYREQMYKAAYPELWRRVAVRVTEDRGASWIAELERRRESCGARYGAAPRVGDSCHEFRNCQRSHYLKKGERQTSSGTAAVFEDMAGHREIYVLNSPHQSCHAFARNTVSGFTKITQDARASVGAATCRMRGGDLHLQSGVLPCAIACLECGVLAHGSFACALRRVRTRSTRRIFVQGSRLLPVLWRSENGEHTRPGSCQRLDHRLDEGRLEERVR